MEASEHAQNICRSKKVFKTLKRGWDGAAQSFIMHGVVVNPYHCFICNQYHLTSRTNTFANVYFEQVEKWLGVPIPEIDPKDT